jgi:hypothetical protein
MEFSKELFWDYFELFAAIHLVGEGLTRFLKKEIGLLMFIPMGHPGASAKTDSMGRFKS